MTLNNGKKLLLTKTLEFFGEKKNLKYICRNNLLIRNIYDKTIITPIMYPDFFEYLETKGFSLSETSIYDLFFPFNPIFPEHLKNFPFVFKNGINSPSNFCGDNIPIVDNDFYIGAPSLGSPFPLNFFENGNYGFWKIKEGKDTDTNVAFLQRFSSTYDEPYRERNVPRNIPNGVTVQLQPEPFVEGSCPAGRINNKLHSCFYGMVVDILDEPIPDSTEFIEV
jgi:hypothetical protein